MLNLFKGAGQSQVCKSLHSCACGKLFSFSEFRNVSGVLDAEEFLHIISERSIGQLCDSYFIADEVHFPDAIPNEMSPYSFRFTNIWRSPGSCSMSIFLNHFSTV